MTRIPPGARPPAAAALALAAAAAAFAQPPAPAAAAHRGSPGAVEVSHPGIAIRAKPVREDAAPVTVRVVALAEGRSRIEFVGLVAGTHDLLPLLERTDGRAIDGLAPVLVSVESQLPPDAGTDLYGRVERALRVGTPYRAAVAAVAAAWVLVPVAVLVRRAMRRVPSEAPAAPAAEPGPVDRLLEEVARARDAEPSVEARGRLELLLLQAVRDAPDADPAASAARARIDPRTSRVVIAVERWLHAPTPGDRASALAEVDALRLRGGGTP